MKRPMGHLAIVTGAAFAALIPAVARGQTTPVTPTGGGGATVAPLQAPQPGTTYAPVPRGYDMVSGQAPNGTVGGGNATESSAHPVTGDQEDSFDLGAGRSSGVAHGDERSPIFIGGPTYSGGETPQSHAVRHGDTLWAICDYYFKNPYQWPRLWSYNPQIKNPNWIYPGDEVRLKEGAPTDAATGGTTPLLYNQGSMNLVDRRRRVPSDTIFLRDQGWIRDASDEVWGDVRGAAADKMFLSDTDEVYLHVDSGHDVHIGQELTIFKPVHPSSTTGTIVLIVGTARVDQWNSRDRVARAQLVESLDVIERGARIGPLARRFVIVPPLRNEIEVQAHVLASVNPHEFYGQNQVVFIDRGESSGIKLGNRFFVVRRGDPWRQSLVHPTAGLRVSADDEKPMPPMEKTPGSRRDDRNDPDEVVAELRVVALKKDTATCVMTQSTVEIERGDLAVARKGY
ncbi:MAG: LysM peptidoglycan-binding domain-containing protein [Myxococcota bacterium]|nr:LysM peptidoglycan-binding domain-containing protein [Myxococcota bacterium]